MPWLLWGATLFVLLSAYGFGDVSGASSADPTRGAAQIVSGIGGSWVLG
ncbi:putative Mg2+ transporter-C (MgtC) family protein [Amycolatopsis marina]|uniref:Mg2+ transporter-C (MgtC) family protein n=2 Tax=Amycolatopsis TaxID=1813 RepID=A0ABR9LFW7_9PSEU|nr:MULTISPECIES: hypothetical protein [Pseudonocardiaceae]MBE1579576.1 putative Mg2+ transporter-C (MgtC) family protein [Amycolatopsis roodepoortensis]SFB63236.1 putative Mg2+ transporter-C (MgtC) family protein [Amycolatopsis marina]